MSHAFGPDSHAGVEVYTARLGRALRARGHAVEVLCGRVRPGSPQNSVVVEQVDGLTVHGLVQNYPYRDLPEAIEDPAVDRAAAGVIRRFRPQIVGVQTLHGLSLGILREAKSAGAAVVVHLHDGGWACASGGQRLHPDGGLCLPIDFDRCGACFDRHRHREGPLERLARRAAARLPQPDLLHRAFKALPGPARDAVRQLNERGARREPEAVTPEGPDPRIEARRGAVAEAWASVDRIVTPSGFLARSLADDGLDVGQAVVVPTGVPELGRAPLPAGGPLRVLFLGTWVPHKGAHVLADALARLDGPTAAGIEAIAVGPAPFPAYRADVLRRAKGRLQAREAVAPGEVPALLAACDLLVVPSTWAENAPLVVLEARSSGRPVLGTALGGLPELIEEGVDGHLLAPGDPAALAEQLGRYAGDRPALLQLAARVRPPRSVGAWAQAIEREYEEALP